MSARPDWRNPNRFRHGWPSDFWPLSTEVPVKVAIKTQAWEVEPSGYVQQGEVRLVELQPTVVALNEGFKKQKAAFSEIPPLILAEYQGQFVASRNGIIVDHDTDLASLTRRFRELYGRESVYITRVGRTARMPTPFLR